MSNNRITLLAGGARNKGLVVRDAELIDDPS